MADYIDRENYCKSICRCSRDKCDKDKCPIWAAPAADVEPVTKERLARYISLKKENENRLERLARMKSNAEMLAQKDPDGSRHTGSGGECMARAIEAYVAYEEQIGPLVEANRREMAEIEAAVAALPDPLEREVLRLRYMDGENMRLLSWKEVAFKLFGECDESSQKRARRIHEKAIKGATISLCGNK